MKYFIFTLGLVLLQVPHLLFSQVQKKKSSDGGIGYLEYLPEAYTESGSAFPCIIFLHGSGERGNGTTDIDKVKKNGPPKLIENGHKMCFEVEGKTECFVVISPQTHRWAWQPFEYIPFTDFIIENYNVDPDRIYLTGLSMGGSGVWMNAYDDLNNPSRFAAIAPIAGYTDEKKACKIAERNIPVWAFHGLSDNAVNPWGQIKMIDAIKACNPQKEITLTLYDGVGHNSWSRAYDATNKYHSPNLYEWFLNQNKNDDPTPEINRPSNLVLKNKSKNSLTIEWQDNSTNESKFIIELKIAGESNFNVISEVTANITQYTFDDLSCNTNYTIRVKAADDKSESSYSNSINENTTSFSPPEIVVTGELSFCEGNSVTLSINENFDDYKWSNGLGTKNIIVTESGNYTVSVLDDGCWSLTSNQVTVNVTNSPPKPIVSGNNNFELCDYKPVILSINNDWEAYEWSTGEITPTIDVKEPGKFAAKVKQNGCWSAFSNSIQVKNAEIPALPVITYPNTGEICEGMEVTLSTNKNYSYHEWSTGANTATIKVTKSGNYYVKVGNCKDLMSDNSEVNQLNFKELTSKPIIKNNDEKTSICPGESISLTGPAGFENYLWSTNQTSKNIEVNQSENITLKVKEKDKCWSPFSNEISIDLATAPDKPEIEYSGSLTLCGNNSITLSTKQSYLQYNWSENSTTPTIKLNKAGSFKVKVKNNECWSQFSNQVTIRNSQTPPTPIISIDQSQEICEGDQVTLSVPNKWQYYQWSNGATTKDNIIEKSGSYSVKVGDCKDVWSASSKPVDLQFSAVTPKPSISVNGKTNLCAGEATEIIGPADYDEYYWSNNSNTEKIIADQPGNYSLKVKNIGYCLSPSSEDINITEAPVPAKPVIEFDDNLILCSNAAVTLSINEDYSRYFWTNNQTTSSISVKKPGNFSAKVSNSFGCWSDYADIVNVIEKPAPSRPEIINSGPIKFCEGDSVTLSVEEEFSYYLWNNNQTSSSIVVKDSGSYSVQVAYCKNQWSNSSKILNINVANGPKNIMVVENYDSLITVQNDNFQYQWYFNNTPLLGATNYYIIPYEKGNYSVKVSNSSDCFAFSEDLELYEQNESMVIFKNPTENGHFRIQIINKRITEGIIKVLSFNSRLILDYQFDKLNDGIIPFDFNIEESNRGIYVVRLISEDRSYSKTLIYR